MAFNELVLPQKIQLDEKTASDFYGKFTAEPYESGYGHTVGNSLRRILLSGMEGAAVTAVRITGAIHEFSTLPNVREDVINILLNLKQLRIKMDNKNREYVTLHATKSGPVTAADIEEVDGVVVSKMSDAEKKELMDKFISLLRPGDVITYGALTGNVGHAMVYVGNGLIIHATGDNYNSDNRTDSHEAAVCYMAVTELFDEENFPQQYVFTQARFCINRPQKMRSASVTDNTASRIDNLFGIIAEKISSTAMGKTVNSGDEITYTFHVINTNNTEKTVTIFDVLSEHVTFVSATNGGQVSDGNITWSLNVPADSRITVSYTVKVKDNLPAYTAIDGTKATINGVAHKCYNTYVVNTLTAAEQQKLVEAVNTVKGMDVTGLNSVQLANLIYKTAFGVDNIFGENVTDFGLLFNGNGTENMGVFGDSVAWANSAFMIIKDANPSKGAMMAAPGMFGGAYTFNGYTKYNGNEVNEPYNRYTSVTGGILRSRYYQEKDLVVGDIFLMKSASQQYLYLYLGNDIFVSLGESLEVFTQQSVSELFQYAPADVWKYHVILRPSMVLDI